MAQCRHCRRSLPLAIHRASMPGRLHDASIFYSPYMVRIFGGTWGIPSDFSFFLLLCMKQRILKRETLVLSGELSLSNENSCSAKDSLKMLMKEALVWKINLTCFTRFISESFRQFSFSFFFNSSTGSPQDSSCRVRVAVLLALMRLLQLKTFAKCALDAVGSAMGTGKTD